MAAHNSLPIVRADDGFTPCRPCARLLALGLRDALDKRDEGGQWVAEVRLCGNCRAAWQWYAIVHYGYDPVAR